MFELISGMSGVIILATCLYVFRRPIKTMTDEAPAVVENVFSTSSSQASNSTPSSLPTVQRTKSIVVFV